MNSQKTQIVTCAHCNGTTLCAHAVQVMDTRPYTRDEYVSMVCDRCGKGPPIPKSEDQRQQEKPRPPVCKVCGGRGFNEVKTKFGWSDTDLNKGFDDPFFKDFDF